MGATGRNGGMAVGRGLRIGLIGIGLLAVTPWALAPSPVAAATTDTKPGKAAVADPFERTLTPLGRWIDNEVYGRLWRPKDVGLFWKPYTDGRWAYLGDAGWLWIGNEPWDWATSHYGRWIRLADIGWAWQPGRRWAPAWVAWRGGAGYWGWAPMPALPRAGQPTPVPRDDEIVDAGWTFVRTAAFLHSDLGGVAMPGANNRELLNATGPIEGGRGPSVEDVSKATHRQVLQVKVVDAERPDQREENLDSTIIPMYRPVSENSAGQPGQTITPLDPAVKQPRKPTGPTIVRPVAPTSPKVAGSKAPTIIRGEGAPPPPPPPPPAAPAEEPGGSESGGDTGLYVGPDYSYLPGVPYPGQVLPEPPPAPPPPVTPPAVIGRPGVGKPGAPLFVQPKPAPPPQDTLPY
jgi:hypothetical protein